MVKIRKLNSEPKTFINKKISLKLPSDVSLRMMDTINVLLGFEEQLTMALIGTAINLNTKLQKTFLHGWEFVTK